MEERQAVVKNLKIHYKIFGQGKPMLILPGWRSNSDRWVKVAELLIQRDLKVVVPDLPGFGKSQEPAAAWSTDDYVEWVKEFADAVPELKDEFYLLGHSFGGTLAAKFAIKYVQRVQKLFLVAASCIRITTPSKKASYNIARFVKLFYFFPYYELFRKFIYKFVLRRSDYPYVSGIMREVYLKVIKEDMSHKLPFLKVPTVIIWGDKDDLTPIEHANIIHGKIPGSTLVVIKDAFHNVNITIPELLTQRIVENV
jgi:pimeloyl-ACP methyl ester carboxylesterase